jgi:hypothetical protein
MGGSEWVLIPIVAILAGTLRRMWLQSNRTRRELGASTHELEGEIMQLTRANAELAERIQNLETIVVSQTWDVLHERGLAPADRDAKLAAVAHHELGGDRAPSSQQRAEELARRLE